MCDFPWMLSFICQRRGRLEQRVKGSQAGGERDLTFAVLFCFMTLREQNGSAEMGFLASLVSFEGEGPSLPRVITPHI